MRRMIVAAMAMALPTAAAQAQGTGMEIPEGAPEAVATCAACHGATGVSVSDTIPNLAGQNAGYIAAQLNAFKAGTRQNPIMNAVAPQLDDDQIQALATYFSQQLLPQAAGESQLLPNLVRDDFPFPDDYESTFTKYHAINFPDRKQVRYYFANDAALEAARQGKPLPDGSYMLVEIHSAKLDDQGQPVTGEDGFFVADKLTGYTAMSREAGWGEEVPELLRNENWNYAVFKEDRSVNTGANQAICLGCHKPHEETSFLFTLDPLKQAAGQN